MTAPSPETLSLIQKAGSFLLFANGSYEEPAWFKKIASRFDCLVGVDGGAHFLLENDLAPHLVVGDLDSLRPEALKSLEGKALIHRDPDQNTFDLEKALLLILKHSDKKIVIAGATGGRFDHALANLMLLSRFTDRDIRLVDATQELFFISPDKSSEKNSWTAPLGTAVSLLPLGEVKGVRSSGLRYECRDLDMVHTGLIGSSNEMSLPEANVSIHTGTLALIVSRGRSF
ncbi:MAG: thiamine diphosphokinase [Spirochaetia bacterium]|nr:thiamine diphosphokinase [Spirochaetia bacterium]